MVYPKCDRCEHTWHGMVCDNYIETLGSWGGIVREPCNCPPQFEEN